MKPTEKQLDEILIENGDVVSEEESEEEPRNPILDRIDLMVALVPERKRKSYRESLNKIYNSII